MRKRKPSSVMVPLQLLTIAQVAEVLGVGPTKVYDLIHRHGLPAVQIDGRLRVRVSSLVSWVEAHETAPCFPCATQATKAPVVTSTN